jgi:hypothetical protein
MPSDENVDLAHQPAVAMFLVVVVFAALFATAVNLRNAGLWLRRLLGHRAYGVVEAIEMSTDSNGDVLRRPRVAFTTDKGERIVSAPAVYRTSTTLAKGMTVKVSYAPWKPVRIVVHGYDVRMREPLYAFLGVLVAVAVSTLYFRI